MNIIRSKDIIDGRPDVGFERDYKCLIAHAPRNAVAHRPSNLRPAWPGGDIHNPSTVIKMKNFFGRFRNPA
jgi:hypothetical protein